jgi:uncharacterized protein YjbI with pentapeptide repeats
MGKDPPESEAKAKGSILKLWQWTGFGEKKLWDFLELLIVPVVLALGAFYFEEQASNRQEQITTTRYQQEALAKYFDQMTQLLLEKKLRQPGSEAQVIARARTLSTLGELDKTRKGLLLKFLYEAKLISQNKQNKTVVFLLDANLEGANLKGADLKGAYLRFANLRGADLNLVNLSGANLSGVDLRFADLSFANLNAADLSFANLNAANLRGANLEGANLRFAELITADLSGAKLINTDLGSADLLDTNLHGADLTGAKLNNTGLDGLVGTTQPNDPKKPASAPQ